MGGGVTRYLTDAELAVIDDEASRISHTAARWPNPYPSDDLDTGWKARR